MLLGLLLYILGFLFVFYSIITLVMMIFADNANTLISLFALLNGFIAMGVGEIVIDLNHKNRVHSK